MGFSNYKCYNTSHKYRTLNPKYNLGYKYYCDIIANPNLKNIKL